MASAAEDGHVHHRRLRSRIEMRDDRVRAVAGQARRREFVAARGSTPVQALMLLVNYLFVALRAAIQRRARLLDLVVAVAVGTLRSDRAVRLLAVHALRERRGFGVVAVRAVDRGHFLVRVVRDGFVTVGAIERSVPGRLEAAGIDVNTDLLPAGFLDEIWILVARETIVRAHLRMCGACRYEQQ